MGPESLLPQNKELDSFSQQLSIGWTCVWSVLPWGYNLSKKKKFRRKVSSEKESLLAIEGLGTSRSAEDKFLYTIPKLAL